MVVYLHLEETVVAVVVPDIQEEHPLIVRTVVMEELVFKF
jgi:hypothetical protein